MKTGSMSSMSMLLVIRLGTDTGTNCSSIEHTHIYRRERIVHRTPPSRSKAVPISYASPRRRSITMFSVALECIHTALLKTHPKASPGASVLRGVPTPSALLNETVFPHHVWIVSAPMVPLAGYCRQKKMRMAAIATPESRAADKTSTTQNSMSQDLRSDVE